MTTKYQTYGHNLTQTHAQPAKITEHIVRTHARPEVIEQVCNPIQIRATTHRSVSPPPPPSPNHRQFVHQQTHTSKTTTTTSSKPVEIAIQKTANTVHHSNVYNNEAHTPVVGMKRGVSRVTAMLQKSTYEFKKPKFG
jgi:hypothetical protein